MVTHKPPFGGMMLFQLNWYGWYLGGGGGVKIHTYMKQLVFLGLFKTISHEQKTKSRMEYSMNSGPDGYLLYITILVVFKKSPSHQLLRRCYQHSESHLLFYLFSDRSWIKHADQEISHAKTRYIFLYNILFSFLLIT